MKLTESQIESVVNWMSDYAKTTNTDMPVASFLEHFNNERATVNDILSDEVFKYLAFKKNFRAKRRVVFLEACKEAGGMLTWAEPEDEEVYQIYRNSINVGVKYVPTIKAIQADNLLHRMLTTDPELYDQITDTPGFAKYFNDLANLAKY